MSLASAKANAVAHWSFDETSAPFADSVGSNNLSDNGTVTAGATGKFANCITINQAGYVYCSDSDALSLSQDQDWSLVAWFYTTTPAIDLQTIAAKGSPREWLLWRLSGIYGDDQLDFQWKNDSGGTTAVASAVNAVEGTGWHCVVVRHRASDHLVELVIDGAVEADTATFSGTALNSTGQFQVGADWDQGAKWLGGIDDVVIIKGYRLTDQDCVDLWNSGTGVAFADWDAGESSITGSGGVVVAGSGTVTVASAITASGGAIAGGAGSPVLAVAPAASGGAVLGGSGTATTSAGATASGGVVIEGAGTAALAASVTASGGVILEGAGAASAAYAVTSSGAVVLAGAASVSAASALTATGGVVIEGAGGVMAAFAITGSGGVVVAGAGSLGNEEYSDTGSGGAFVGGSGTASLAVSLTASGGVVLAGAGTATLGAAVMGSGGVVFAGAGGVSAAYRLTGTGGPTILGAGVDSSGDTVYSMAVLVQAALPSQPVIRGARMTTSPVIRAVSWGPVIVRAALPT